jgi:uncharacterized protein (TIGR04141 family)
MQKRTHSLTIYLIKKAVDNEGLIVSGSPEYVNVEGVGKLFYKASHQNPPRWLSFFRGQRLDDLFTSSASAVLLVRVSDRYFAVTFGPAGRYLLQEGVTEERFGLIVTLNSVKEKSIRSVDTKTLESEGIQTRIQSSRPVAADNFGFNVERDLVRSVTGESQDPAFGSVLSGKDSLRVSLKVDLEELKDYLSTFLRQFQKTDYKKQFPWIDALKEINDSAKIEKLNLKLVEEINKDEIGKLWLTIPEIIDWTDHGGFKYSGRKKDQTLDDIQIDSFKEYLENAPITLSDLTSIKVHRFSQSNEHLGDHWRVYDCLYFEHSTEDETSFLTGGKWYSVKANLVKTVNDYYKGTSDDTHGIDFIDFNHEDENTYNQALADANGALCVDRDNIKIEGRSTFEFCDVYTKNKSLVHIKRYSSSAVLSHLFNQGFVSASFLLDKEFRKKISDGLDSGFKIKNVATRPNINDAERYNIIFGIVSKSPNDFELPFFSKMTLMHVTKDLVNFGYKVSLIKIRNLKPDKIEEE